MKKDDKNSSKIELWEHQKLIVDNILPEMDKRNFSTIVELPTGAGKTMVAVKYCEKVLKKGHKVLWLCDRVDLLKQSVGVFDNQGLDGVSYQLVTGTECSIKEIDTHSNMLFVSLGMLRKFKKRSNRFTGLVEWLKASQDDGKLYIIYDEAHHIGADSVGALNVNDSEGLFAQLFLGDEALIKSYGLIGLTATAFRMDSSYRVFNKWFKDGYKGDECKDGTYDASKCTHSKTPIGIEEDEKVEEVIGSIKTVDMNDLIEAGVLMNPTLVRVDDFKNGMPSDEMRYLADKIKYNYRSKNWNKTLVFVRNLKDAEKLQRYLRQEKVDCFVYASVNVGDTKEKVEENLDSFQKLGNRNSPIMIAVDKVSEGFDVKDIKTVYLYAPTESFITLKQRVGRVLRKCKGKDKALVYWQNYFDYSDSDRGIVKSVTSYEDVEEKDIDIRGDIGKWHDGLYIPASMFNEPVKIDAKRERNIYKYYELLNIIDMFGLTSDDVDNLVGSLVLKTSNGSVREIPVRDEELLGYSQLWLMLSQDYYSFLRYAGKPIDSFKHYAEFLGIKSEELLLRDIKTACFYRANTRGSDTSGRRVGKRFAVDDDDIKEFCSFVLKNSLAFPEFSKPDIDVKNKIHQTGEDMKNDYKDVEPQVGEDTKNDYKDVEPQVDEDLLKAIEDKKDYDAKHPKTNNRPKVYTDVLSYGSAEDTYVYEELLSMRTLMALGVTIKGLGDRKVGTLDDVTGELAFIGMENDGKISQIKPTNRIAWGIPTSNNLFIAQALNTVPNHICVTEDDVKEYSDALKSQPFVKRLKTKKHKTELVTEFIMALGYRVNQDDIIRMQCKIFKDKLPRLLQYVIYCRCYENLAKEVKFDGLSCGNEDALKKEYTDMLNRYRLNESMISKDLDVIGHVIDDYTPYMKPVPYYQGIKPEFLCRMIDDLLRLGCGGKKTSFIDAFGGSGTVSMNVNKKLVSDITYNDRGIYNYAFYKTLKNTNLVEKLKCKIEDLLKVIFTNQLDEQKLMSYFNRYLYLFGITGEYKDIDINAMETAYAESVSGKKEKEYQRLQDQREGYCKNVLKHFMKNVDEGKIANIEKCFHVFVLALGQIYNATLDSEKKELSNDECVDLALLFILLNCFSARHFYNDAKIRNLVEFACTYEKNIHIVNKVFKKVKLHREDANKLLAKEKEGVWYCDIPYTGSDTRSYVQNENFEENFISGLSKCRGNYMVASRYNIWEDLPNGDGKKHNYNSIKFGEVAQIEPTYKQYEILKFFGRFLDERFLEDYKNLIYSRYDGVLRTHAKKVVDNWERGSKEVVHTEKPELYDIIREYRKQKSGITTKESSVPSIDEIIAKDKEWTRVEDSKKAKYIVFAYSKRRVYAVDENKSKLVEPLHELLHTGQADRDSKELVSLSQAASLHMGQDGADDIAKMIQSTLFSRIPMEVVITNLDLIKNTNRLPVQELADGVWYLPTFKTLASAYPIEPLTIIMEYEKFYKEILLDSCLDKKELQGIESREQARNFREMFDGSYGNGEK